MSLKDNIRGNRIAPQPFNKAADPRPGTVGHRPDAPCSACSVRQLTICAAIAPDELSHLADVATEIKLAPGKSLFYEGEATKYAFNVTSGTLKTYKLLPDGRRQITGFQVTGDFLGLADRGTYVHSAEAVSATTLCRFSRDRLRELMDGFPALGHRLLEKASSELAMAHDQMVLLGRKTAREKIASFLLMLSQRANQSGHGEGSLAIEMTRTDIGDYLGLTTETVSRTFTQLKSDKILSIGKGSEIIFLDRESLVKIADGFANK